MRTVIVGTGRMGRRHIQVANQLRLDVVGISDRSREALVAAGTEHGVPESAHFTDVDLMLREARPEVVVVSTHAPTHCDLVCRAAESGARFILCEKPMAVSLAECDRMLAACRRTGARLAINHQMRFMEQYTRPKAIVNSEEFGGLASVTVVAGNFGIAMNGSHYFEMFRYLTDEDPAEVTAWFSETRLPNPRGPEFEDRAGSVRVTTASGKRFYMEIGDDQGHGMHVVYAGRNGRLAVDELAGTTHLAVREAQHRALPTTRYGMPWIDTTDRIAPADAVAPTQAVLSALLEDRDYPSGEHGRLAVATLVAAYLSNEQDHRPIAVRDADAHAKRVFPWA